MRSGFSLIELLITSAIIVAIAASGFLGLAGEKSSRNVRLSLEEMVSAIRGAQKRSVTQQSGKQWGITFTNPTETPDKYEIWSGTSYASGTIDQVYTFRRGIEFSEPFSSSSFDAIFAAVTGTLSQDKIISLIPTGGKSMVGDAIINSLGFVTHRLETNIVGYWHFDEVTSTTAYDATGNGNNGILTAGPTWQSAANCRAGVCLNFDGTDDYVSRSDNTTLSITGSITLSAWVKRDTTGVDIIAAKWNSTGNQRSYELQFNVSNRPQFFVSSDGTAVSNTSDSGSAVTDTSWHHVAGVYDGSNLIVYLDGAAYASTTYSSGIFDSTAGFRVGADDNGTLGEFFDGLIDEVRVYSKALSSTDVSNQYNDLK